MAGRVFGYCRVSTQNQTTDNQIGEIRAAGFAIDGKRVVTEVISGSSAISQRKGFQRLLDRMEAGDVLVVTKLDRLGRNAIDVATTVKRLEANGVHVHCLALGGTDLTSSAGKMIMGVLAAVAEFEKDQLIERTEVGLARARKAGRVGGRPVSLSNAQRAAAVKQLADGASVSAVAKEMKVSRATVMRAREAG